MPEKFESAVLFLRLGVPSTPIRHETDIFENAVQTEFENAPLRFVVDKKHILKKEPFENNSPYSKATSKLNNADTILI